LFKRADASFDGGFHVSTPNVMCSRSLSDIPVRKPDGPVAGREGSGAGLLASTRRSRLKDVTALHGPNFRREALSEPPRRRHWGFPEPFRADYPIAGGKPSIGQCLGNRGSRSPPNQQQFVRAAAPGFQLHNAGFDISRDHCEVILSRRSRRSANSAVSNAFT
jgi:hypothetical protein